MLNQLNLMGNCIGKGKAKHHVTLAILGLDNAGKTVTTKGLQGETLDTVAPTVGFSSVDFRFEKTDVTLFDLGGGKKIRDIWKNYLSEVYGVIYVVDSSQPERLDEGADVINALIEHPKVNGKPILVLANKQDVKGAMDDIDIIQGLRLEELVNTHKCPCQIEMCSATLGQGKKLDRSIRKGMKWLLAYIRENWPELDERVKDDVAEQREREKQDRRERAERVRIIREEREAKEKADRLARGEASGDGGEEEDDDKNQVMDLVDGNPFKALDVKQLAKKEAQEKEERRRRKEEEKRRAVEKKQDDEDEPDNLSARRKKSHRHRRRLRLSDDDEEEDEVDGSRGDDTVVAQYPISSSLQPKFTQSEADAGGGHRNSLEMRAPLSHSETTHHRTASDEEEELGGLGSRWRKQRSKGTPRPEDIPAGYRRGGGLAPIGHVGNLEPLESISGKKKKKRKAKKNQTAPAGLGEGSGDDAMPRGWPAQSLNKASRSPDLNTTHENPAQEEDFSSKWGLVNDDLADLGGGVDEDSTSYHRSRSRPNSEFDDEIVT